MGEYSVPAKFSIGDDENCTNIIFGLAQRSPQHIVFRHKQGDRWEPVTAAEAASRMGMRLDRSELRDVASEIEWSKVSLLTPETYAAAARRARRQPPGG